MINLGLRRISELLVKLGNPIAGLNAFHVAGTNGKGSVCTYLESVLSSRMTVGKYTSPHLIAPNDSIQINQKPLRASEHEKLTAHTRSVAEAFHIDATEFETQTAVAFQAFKQYAVDTAVIEVGLGGLDDATNVLEPRNVRCSAITKVSIDHEAFLGTTLASVAKHKAGIIKPGVPCIVDGTNAEEVLEVVANRAKEVRAPLHVTSPHSTNFVDANKAVARAALQQVYPDLCASEIECGFAAAHWPGRLQWIDERTLVDGAHNISAAKELRKYVDALNSSNLRWVVAFSKPAGALLDVLVKHGDHVLATEFSRVEGMPWVKAQPSQTVAQEALKKTPYVSVLPSIESLSNDFPGTTVVCGSLYLVGQYMRQRTHEQQTL